MTDETEAWPDEPTQQHFGLIFNDKEQDEQDVRLAAKFWKQFELEPQIESRLVSKDNIQQSSRLTETRNRVRSQPAPPTQHNSRGGSANSIRNNTANLKFNRSNSQTKDAGFNSRPQTRTISVSDMVKQLKQTNKFLNRNEEGEDEMGSAEFGMSDSEVTIETEMQQLDNFDEKQALLKT